MVILKVPGDIRDGSLRSGALRRKNIRHERIVASQAVCVTRFDQSEGVIFGVVFAFGKSRFESGLCWKFPFFLAGGRIFGFNHSRKLSGHFILGLV